MSTSLYIIGTGHHYQFGAGTAFGDAYCSQADHSAFLQMLRDLAIKYSVDAIAEELSEEALRDRSKHTSVPRSLARQLGIHHLFCDPDRDERTALQIYAENAIRISAFSKTLDEETVSRQIEHSWNRREEEWLRRLATLGAARIIFVCGANHIRTFGQLATKRGFCVQVVHDDWVA